jgi:SpoVK/Ycf46/Vps4 family AAA+-type ATPase
MDKRLEHMNLFAPDAPLQAERILEDPHEPGEPGPWTPLVVSQTWLDRLVLGGRRTPRFGPDFPAQLVVTQYDWDDLVLTEETREEIEDIVAWVRNEALLMGEWGLGRHLKPGYRALFHGPPGTGKTVTAAVLGKRLGRPVYRVDLSRVVSKYIGETEKNLAALFDHASEGDMILFFDEADALFGKRGETRTANDRHANQQIAYLLQRVEDCPGVVILATNLKANMDPAFARRFQATIGFPMPDAEARRDLWALCFEKDGGGFGLCRDVDLDRLARDHELAGGSIVNILRHAGIQAVRSGGEKVSMAALREGLRKEMRKDGRIVAG